MHRFMHVFLCMYVCTKLEGEIFELLLYILDIYPKKKKNYGRQADRDSLLLGTIEYLPTFLRDLR